jgi:SET and MYND domain-containing protein
MQSHAHGADGFDFSFPDGITDTSTLSFYTAKSRICIDDNGNPGRGVFAGNDYAAGEEIGAKRRPTIASLDTERLGDTCANCFVWTEGTGSGGGSGSRLYVKEGVKVSACTGCKRFRYCSKACQKEAWSRGHKFECKALKQEGLIDRPMPKAVLATMEVLIRRKHGLLAEQEWGSFVFAQSHVEDFKETGQYAGIELMALGVGKFSGMEGSFDRAQVAAMYARVGRSSSFHFTHQARLPRLPRLP